MNYLNTCGNKEKCNTKSNERVVYIRIHHWSVCLWACWKRGDGTKTATHTHAHTLHSELWGLSWFQFILQCFFVQTKPNPYANINLQRRFHKLVQQRKNTDNSTLCFSLWNSHNVNTGRQTQLWDKAGNVIDNIYCKHYEIHLNLYFFCEPAFT